MTELLSLVGAVVAGYWFGWLLHWARHEAWPAIDGAIIRWACRVTAHRAAPGHFRVDVATSIAYRVCRDCGEEYDTGLRVEVVWEPIVVNLSPLVEAFSRILVPAQEVARSFQRLSAVMNLDASDFETFAEAFAVTDPALRGLRWLVSPQSAPSLYDHLRHSRANHRSLHGFGFHDWRGHPRAAENGMPMDRPVNTDTDAAPFPVGACPDCGHDHLETVADGPCVCGCAGGAQIVTFDEELVMTCWKCGARPEASVTGLCESCLALVRDVGPHPRIGRPVYPGRSAG